MMDDMEKVTNFFQSALSSEQWLALPKKFKDRFDKMGIHPTLPMRVDLDLVSVELRPSNRHGLGCFAIRNIRKDEVITMYPCDVVINQKMNHRNIVFSDRLSDHIRDTLPNPQEFDYRKYFPYGIGLEESLFLIGYPGFKDDTNYLGHFINDGAKANSDKRSHTIYETVTALKRNCKFQSVLGRAHMAVVATRDIEKDEELLTTYGLKYWLSKQR